MTSLKDTRDRVARSMLLPSVNRNTVRVVSDADGGGMNAKIRRRIEMGVRALLFSREHSDSSPGYQAALARLEELVERAEQLFLQQQNGRLQEHASAVRKIELRRMMKLAHLAHLASAAQAASVEEPELRQKFRLTRAASPFHAFQTAARLMEAEARNHFELLERHGLAKPVLDSLRLRLDELDDSIAGVSRGRVAHVGARAELEVIAREVVQTVKLLNGFNQLRFARDGEALGAWNSARKVINRAGRTELPPAA